ncbi:nitronate monooxygenase [Rapidithrix thailandica]|uniref:Nitronate monooxygenase n=1 Tax=Rapidithrix thailandica TaxID=413964 RepID=A0AAW9S8M6_9BACT
MELTNQLTQQLAVRYPIIQAPMLGITTPEMVAAVSNAGGLGSLPIGGLAPEKARQLIRKTKSLTGKPFAVNLFAHTLPTEVDWDSVEKMQHFLEELCAKYGVTFSRFSEEDFTFYTYQDQLEVLQEEEVGIVSFTFGLLDSLSIALLHKRDVKLIGTATCVEEAILLEESGVDMISAQGIEAGGHRGSFTSNHPLPMIGSMTLIPQVVQSVKVPVVAAGGISDGMGIKAAFSLGAQGVQVGSLFLRSHESAANEAYKESILHSKDTDTALTRSFSGRWARGVVNQFMKSVEASGLSIPPYPVQNSLTAAIRASAKKQGKKDFLSLWGGQAASKAPAKSSREIFDELLSSFRILLNG